MVRAILTAAIASGLFIWLRFQQPALPEGFASGNGRIEATEIDVWPYFAAVVASGAVFFGVALLRFRRMVTLMQS